MKKIITLLFIVGAYYNSNAQIPTEGLIREYLFNGNANCSINASNNGTVNGATLTTDRHGNPNAAYDFNATNKDFIDLPTTGLDNDTYTVSLWVQMKSDPNPRYFIYDFVPVDNVNQPIVSQSISYNKNYTPTANQKYNGFGYVSYYNNAGGAHDTIYSKTNINTTDWYHIVVVKTATDIKMFVNGALVNSENTTQKPYYTGVAFKCNIGCRYNKANNFNGKIDDVRIYNRGISDIEVKQIYDTEILSTSNNKIDNSVFRISPNPTTDILNIKVNKFELGQTYQIYNNQGTVILSGAIESETTTIPVKEKLINGIYTVNLYNNENRLINTSKIIVQ